MSSFMQKEKFSFWGLKKQKTDMDDLMGRVEEFTRSVGQSFENTSDAEASGEIVLTSLALKIGKGESLVKEISAKAEQEQDANAKALLDQLSLAVSGELKNLVRIKQAYINYDSARKADQVLSREETLRKLKSGLNEFAEKQRTQESL